MQLRIANKKDADGIVELLSHLHSNSIYSSFSEFNKDDVLKGLMGILEGDPRDSTAIVLEEDGRLVGTLVCSVMPHLFNHKARTAVELGFWIDPQFRSASTIKLLLKSYKYWARVANCQTIMYGKLKSRDAIEEYIIRKL